MIPRVTGGPAAPWFLTAPPTNPAFSSPFQTSCFHPGCCPFLQSVSLPLYLEGGSASRTLLYWLSLHLRLSYPSRPSQVPRPPCAQAARRYARSSLAQSKVILRLVLMPRKWWTYLVSWVECSVLHPWSLLAQLLHWVPAITGSFHPGYVSACLDQELFCFPRLSFTELKWLAATSWGAPSIPWFNACATQVRLPRRKVPVQLRGF